MGNKAKYSFRKIEGEYAYISDFVEGLALVENNYEERKAGYIDQTGKLVIPLDYYCYCSEKNLLVDNYFSEGLAPLIKNNHVGFVDRNGKTAVPFIYDNARSFQEGLAAVQKDHKWGFVNKQGEIEVPMEYEYVDSFYDGLAGAYRKEKFGFIDKTGETVIPFEYDEGLAGFSEGLTVVEKDGKKGCIDQTGKVVIPIELEYALISPFQNGLAGVLMERPKLIQALDGESEEDFLKRAHAANKHIKWGYIDRTGALVIPMKYNARGPFCEGFAVVEENGKRHYIDQTGNIPFDLDFDMLDSFHDGLALAWTDRHYSVINKEGKVVIDFEDEYEDVARFAGDYWRVEKDGKCGIIDRSGASIVPIEYEEIRPLSEGLSVARKDGKWGILAEYYS